MPSDRFLAANPNPASILSPDSIPQLSLGTAALIIFAVCAGFVLLRGMTRLLVGTVVLCVSAWIAFMLWQKAPALSLQWTGKSLPWIVNGLPVAGFLISFIGIRKITKAVASPFRKRDDNQPRSVIGTALRLLLALVPTSLIWLVGATLVHHTGSVAEVRSYSEKAMGLPETAPDAFSQRLKASVEAALPASWLKALDPLAEPSRLNLAKLISAQSDSPLKPVIDPRTGKPIPRAIIVDNPDLQNLAREGKFGTLLRHPLLTKALADPKIKQLLKDLNL